MNKRVLRLILVPLTATALFLGVFPANAAGTDLRIGASTLGKIVVNGKGMSAYFYDQDKANSGKSACSGACATYWPPITSATSKPVLSGILGKVSTIPGPKGRRQITVNGRPIYTYSFDKVPGDVTGQGLQGVWHVLSAAGVEIKALRAATPSATPKASAASTASGTYSSGRNY